MTLTHSACASPPPPLHLFTCPPVHLCCLCYHIIISWYVDALLIPWRRDIYLDVKLLWVKIPWCQDVDHIVVSWCVDMFVYSGEWYPFTAASRHHSPSFHGNMISQHPWSIDKHLPDSLNIRCSTRCLRQQAVEQYMAMMWADGRVGSMSWE